MNRKPIIAGMLITAAVVILAAAFASSHPDGLEWVAERLGFISKVAEEPVVASPLPDYAVGIIKSPFWSTAVAGFLGAGIVLCVVLLVGRLLRKR